MSIKRYLGKYRGTAANLTPDPLNRARIQAVVPAVSSLLPTTWCEPCLPLAGIAAGAYFVPVVGTGVWIEFEQGDPNRPIWTGCFWGDNEVPPLAILGNPESPSIVLQTALLQNMIMISDVPGPTGGVLLQIGPTPGIASVSISDTSIILQSGLSQIMMTKGVINLTNGTASIMLTGSSVEVNGTALVIT